MAEGRRDRLCIEALDPETGHTCVVQISQQRLLTIAKWGAWAVKEAAQIVPDVLQHPLTVFEGLRQDEDEDPRGVGWRCYCGKPTLRFQRTARKRTRNPTRSFLSSSMTKA